MIQELLDRVESACRRSGRTSGQIQILAVSKGQGSDVIRGCLKDPQFPRALGENYLQELEQKVVDLKDLALAWHFTGRLQSRKISQILKTCSVLHTVSRASELEMIQKLNSKAQFFIQVNVAKEHQKSGCEVADLERLLESLHRQGIQDQCIGLMTLPPSIDEAGELKTRYYFSELRKLRDQFLPRGKLSMGMSADFEIAIEEGADWVRLGTVLFGPRL